MGPHFPGLRLVYAGYRDSTGFPQFYAPTYLHRSKISLTVPLDIWTNYQRLERLHELSGSSIHHCGGIFWLPRGTEESLATVHDLFPDRLPISALRSPRIVADSSLRNVVNLVNHRLLARFSQIASISAVTRDEVYRRVGRQSTVVYHWINEKLFRPREKHAARERLGLPRNRKLILNVSSNRPSKNSERLGAIASRLPADYALVRVGPRTSSERILSFSGLPDDQYAQLFNACDVYLHISSEEGFGRPLIESMGSKLPVISSDTPVSREILGRGAYFLKDAPSVESTVSDLRRFFREGWTGPVLEAARENQQRFSSARAAALYKDLYERTLT